MKIKCIIVEDEPKAMSLIEEYVLKTTFLTLTSKFYNAHDALNYLQEHRDVALVFLDINLPELSGMDMANIIDPSLNIIFTTAHSDFAAKSYEVNTVDYLLKPITYARFFQAALKVKNVVSNQEQKEVGPKQESYVFVKSGKTIIQVGWADIHYIEALKEYASIVTASQKIVVYKRMTEFERIQPGNFTRVHNSFIVNLNKIERVEDNIVFINNREIPVSKSYKDDFFAKIKGKLI